MNTPFRTTVATVPTGVTVVSTVVDGQPHGMTVNSFVSISIDPLLVLVSVHMESRTYQRIARSGAFAVTALSDGQEQVARWFADAVRPSGAEAFAGISWKPAPHTRSPILLDGVSYFDCTVHRMYVAGDHMLVIGDVLAYDLLYDRPPLLFVRSHFTELRT
jgi:flavin reductase (DIM6/NTAB) family NADH-FMN oxidoreductase RutF